MTVLERVVKTMEIVKVTELKIYDMEKSSPFFDYVVVATANERQANALVSYLKDEFKEDLIKGVEGKTGGWLLIDMKDIIVHVFSSEQRDYYGFDRRMIGFKQIEL